MKIPRTVLAIVTAPFAICAFAGGCDGGGGGGGEPDVIMPATTVVLDAATLALLTAVSDDGVTYTFSTATAALDAIDAHDVVLGGVSALTPAGLLRRVKSIKRAGHVVLTTSPAALTDAFQRLRLTTTVPLKRGDVVAVTTPAPGLSRSALTSAGDEGLTFGFDDEVLYDADGDRATIDDQIRASGSVALHASVELSIDIEDFAVESVTLALGGEEGSSLNVWAGAAFGFDKDLQVARFQLTPIVIPIGNIPLVLLPDIRIHIAARGSATATFETGIIQHASFRTGVEYRNGAWDSIGEASFDADLDGPHVRGTLTVGAFAGPSMSLLLYGLTGPYAGVDAYVQVDADTAGVPCWSLEAGLNGVAGYRAGFLGALIDDYETSGNLIRIPLADGACPGADAEPPWSRTYGLTGFGPSRTAADATSLSGLVVAGQGSRHVMRLDADGAVEWERQFDEAAPEAVVALDDGSVILAGSSVGAWMAKLDPRGDVIWSRRYAPPAGATIDVLTLGSVSDGGFVVGGTAQPDGPNIDGWVMKVDADGHVQWSTTFGGTQIDQVAAIRETAAGDLLAVGSGGDVGNVQGLAVGLKFNGAIAWQVQVGDPLTNAYFEAVAPFGDEGFVLGGNIAHSGATDGWLVRIDRDGALVGGDGASVRYQSRTGDDTAFDQISVRDLRVRDDGTLFGTGTVWDSSSPLDQQVWVFEIAYSTSGLANAVWSRSFGADGMDEGYALRFAGDGTMLVAGVSAGLNVEPTGNAWVLHVPRSGALDFAIGSGVTDQNLTGALIQGTRALMDQPLIAVVASPTSFSARPLAVTEENLASGSRTTTINPASQTR